MTEKTTPRQTMAEDKEAPPKPEQQTSEPGTYRFTDFAMI